MRWEGGKIWSGRVSYTLSIKWNMKTIFFVGLSSKNDTEGNKLPAFDRSTLSGKILNEVEKKSQDSRIIKINLVPWTPLENEKIRYPNASEKEVGWQMLLGEIEKFQPQKIFLFGKEVADFVCKKIGVQQKRGERIIFWWREWYIFSHPAYIGVYRRKEKDLYVASILWIIKEL